MYQSTVLLPVSFHMIRRRILTIVNVVEKDHVFTALCNQSLVGVEFHPSIR
jgi:hypothetical protein